MVPGRATAGGPHLHRDLCRLGWVYGLLPGDRPRVVPGLRGKPIHPGTLFFPLSLMYGFHLYSSF